MFVVVIALRLGITILAALYSVYAENAHKETKIHNTNNNHCPMILVNIYILTSIMIIAIHLVIYLFMT